MHEPIPPSHDRRHPFPHLHQHPELALAEHATSDFVAGKLQEWGYDVTRGIAGTGLVGTLRVRQGRMTMLIARLAAGELAAGARLAH